MLQKLIFIQWLSILITLPPHPTNLTNKMSATMTFSYANAARETLSYANAARETLSYANAARATKTPRKSSEQTTRSYIEAAQELNEFKALHEDNAFIFEANGLTAAVFIHNKYTIAGMLYLTVEHSEKLAGRDLPQPHGGITAGSLESGYLQFDTNHRGKDLSLSDFSLMTDRPLREGTFKKAAFVVSELEQWSRKIVQLLQTA